MDGLPRKPSKWIASRSETNRTTVGYLRVTSVDWPFELRNHHRRHTVRRRRPTYDYHGRVVHRERRHNRVYLIQAHEAWRQTAVEDLRILTAYRYCHRNRS